ncbi:hypothetical protein Tco_1028436 [Tanacetum coccineum]|uniref:Uncharacterized protein n=1 Tax=Tanacetum coccineum TaxID=301880 RepID=A0ABQ5G1Z7_9ASTR
MSDEVGKIKVLRIFEIVEHDGGTCIYGVFVSVDTNDLLTNNEFLILHIGRKIISKDNGRNLLKGFLKVVKTSSIRVKTNVLIKEIGKLDKLSKRDVERMIVDDEFNREMVGGVSI